MKKIYIGLIVSSVLASSFFPLFNVYASETVSSNTESVETSNDNGDIQNRKALSVYEEAIKGNHALFKGETKFKVQIVCFRNPLKILSF